MHPRPIPSLALAAALLGAGLTLASCGPGDPPSPPTTGDPGGGGGGGSGGGGSGGGDSGGGGGGGDAGGSSGGGGGGAGSGAGPSVPTTLAAVLGGAGDEGCQDVAAAPGGAVVALTVVGPHGDGRVDQLGLTRVDGGGAPGRLYDVGAPVAFPRDGALSVGPGGEVYLALTARCGGSGCAGLGARLDGSALVQFSEGGDPRWVAPLPGDVVSQPVVDPPGNVAVATSEGGTNVVRSFAPSGAPRWQVPLPGGASADVSLAADAGGNVVAARGGDVTKIGANGAIAWSRSVAAQVAGVAGTASGVVVVAGTTSTGPAILLLGPDGADGAVVSLPGPADGVRVEVGTGRRIGAVTGAGGCGATVTALDLDGAQLWSRPVATSGCDGAELRVNAVTVTTAGVVVIGGALDGTVDLGGAEVSSTRTDALIAGFGS